MCQVPSLIKCAIATTTNSLWADPRNADVQIECKGLVWHVHRHVLVAVSDWMEKHMPPPQAAGSSRNVSLNKNHPPPPVLPP